MRDCALAVAPLGCAYVVDGRRMGMKHGVVLMTCLVACGGQSEVPGGDAAAPVADAGGDGATDGAAGPTHIPLPMTPAGERLRWVLDTINAGPSGSATANFGDVFAPSFLNAIPAEALNNIFLSLYEQLAPVSAWQIERNRLDHLVVVTSSPAGAFVRAEIATDASGRINTLFFTLAPESDPSLGTFEGIEAALRKVAANVHVVVADLATTGCAPRNAVAADVPMPLGSAFKLYVLAAAAAAVEGGTLSWSHKIAIRDDWKSLPSGTFQNLAAGTDRTLVEYASNMMAGSDNTATDHLIHTVGRSSVEAHQSLAGHSAPQLNVPFLTTRELFILKWGETRETHAAYANGNEAERRALLSALAQQPLPSVTAVDPKVPVATNLEWFATPMDICRVFHHLKLQSETATGAPLRGILSKNPGIDVRNLYRYVGFKGGSEPGVLSLNWLLQREDGQWQVVSLGLSDGARPISEWAATHHALALLRLAAM